MTQMTSPYPNARLAYLADKPLPAAAQIALAVAVVVVKWEHNRRSRIALRNLDDHLLTDIGLKREQAFHEARLPFWR